MEGLIQLQYMPTSQQLADILTKTVPSTHLQPILSKLGMIDTMTSLRGDVKDVI